MKAVLAAALLIAASAYGQSYPGNNNAGASGTDPNAVHTNISTTQTLQGPLTLPTLTATTTVNTPNVNGWSWGSVGVSNNWLSPPTGLAGIGDGAAGTDVWIAHASGAGNFFTDAQAGDIVYRGALGTSIRFGIDNGAGGAASELDVATGSITANVPVTAPNLAYPASANTWTADQTISTTDNIPFTVTSNSGNGSNIYLANTSTGGNKFSWASNGASYAVGTTSMFDFGASAVVWWGYGRHLNETSNGVFGWGTSTTNWSSTLNAGISSTGADLISFGNGAQGDASANIAAGSLTLSGTKMSAVPHMTFWGDSSASYAGGVTNTGGAYTPSAAITLTGLDVHIGTAFAGCTTSPLYEVYDQTAAAATTCTVTLTNGSSNVHAACSANVPAGHLLTFGLVVGSGCTAGQYLNSTAEYIMQ